MARRHAFSASSKACWGYYPRRALETRKLAQTDLGLGVEGQEEIRSWRWQRPDLRGAATRLAYDHFPSLATLALKTHAAGLRFNGIPQIFSRDLRQISPSLNDDLLDLYGRSEQALANRLTFFNLSEEFGEDIDWERHASPAWCAELHSFDYVLGLALTYRISREERYARHLRYLIAQWIAANPPGQGSGWMLRTLSRRIRNWILAADLARDDWERDTAFLHLVTESLALQAVFLSEQSRADGPSRGSLDCARALQLAGRFFNGTAADELCRLALSILHRELGSSLQPGGNTSPAPGAQLQLTQALMDLFLFATPDDEELRNWLKPKLLENLQTLEGMLLPDGTLPLFGPTAESAPDALADLFALAAVTFEEPRWKTLAGHFGIFPYMLAGERGKTLFARLPHRPWTVEDRVAPHSPAVRLVGVEGSALLGNAVSNALPHGHEDFLSYELFLAGQRVIVDSGAFSPEGETWNPHFASPHAHNVLLVDGRGPCAIPLDGCTAPIPEYESRPEVVRLLTENPGFKFLGLDHARAWYCLDERHWVVLDRLEGTGAHRCASLIHFYPTFTVDIGGGRATARSRSFSATIIPLGSPDVVTTSKGDDSEFPGWYAPDYGIKYAAAVLKLEWAPCKLPWLGGYVIVPGGEIQFRAGHFDPAAGIAEFELFEKKYRLPVG